MKYKLTNITKQIKEKTLYRIIALKDFNDVKSGDLGGWVESENNLSQEGNCWLYNDSMVYDNGLVSEFATLYDFSEVCDNAKALKFSTMRNHSKLCNDALLLDLAIMNDNSMILDNAAVGGYNELSNNVKVCGSAYLSTGNMNINGNAKISKVDDCIEFRAWWLEDNTTITWTRNNNKYSFLDYCYNSKEFIDYGYKQSNIAGKQCELLVNYVEKSILIGVNPENNKNKGSDCIFTTTTIMSTLIHVYNDSMYKNLSSTFFGTEPIIE